MSRFIIFGSGGFGRELIGPAKIIAGLQGEEVGHIVFAVDNPSARIFDGDVPEIATADIQHADRVIVAIGDSGVRKQVAERIDCHYGTMIAATAIIGPEVVMGEGAVICDHVIITASARIGRHFQANIYSYIAHDCIIGDFVTLAPRASINGNVHVGDGAYIGTGAVIKQGSADQPIVIGRDAVIGMGAVVTKSVEAGVTVMGNPARPR